MPRPSSDPVRNQLRKLLSNMIARCHRITSPGFRKYGARGITVCDEWRNDPEAFFQWALANGYSPGLQIDRRKSHIGYTPGNCRFGTSAQNNSNRPKFSRRQYSSPYKGVAVARRADGARFISFIKVNKKSRHLGTFDTAEQAAAAYNAAAVAAFGEFACLNKIPAEAQA